MNNNQIILSYIIYVFCISLLLEETGRSLIDELTKLDISFICVILLIVAPYLTNLLISKINNSKTKYKHSLLNITLFFTITFLTLKFILNTFNFDNKTTAVLSSWESGMPKEVSYNYYSNKNRVINISYFDSGNIKSKVEYINGKKSGREFFFNQNSSYKKINSYITGDLIEVYDFEKVDKKLNKNLPKLFTSAHNKTSKKIEENFESVMTSLSPCYAQEYTLSEFHKNGNLKKSEKYINDKVNGLSLEFYENGNIKARGIKKEFDKLGTWQYFDINGNLSETKEYK